MLNLFLQVKVTGDGVCPNCGSDNYDNVHTEFKDYGFDYELPIESYLDAREILKCCNCKATFRCSSDEVSLINK